MAQAIHENGRRLRIRLVQGHGDTTMGYGRYVGPVPGWELHAVALESPDGDPGQAVVSYPAEQLVRDDA